MRYAVFTIGLALMTSAAQADCPAAPDQTARLKALIEQVRAAPDERAAQRISLEMWDVWDDAPNEQAQALLNDGMMRRENQDFVGALAAFEKLIDYCPDYAEGYNQRAFVLFIQQNYEPALADLDRAIERSPMHIAAIAGKALTLIGLRRDAEAQIVLREALALNPWLKERRFLTEPAPLPKTDL